MPAEALVIHAKATSASEKKAILAYVDIRQRCMSYFKDTVASLPWPADMSDELKQRLVEGFNNYADNLLRSGKYLSVMLYEGQITYGEFNRQRGDLNVKSRAELSAYTATIDAQDRAETLQKAAAAQREVDAAVTLLASAACATAHGSTARALCQ
jgi:site-specific DNA-adenine methylase